ncbi:MAG: MFS transporter [Rikenella sp.]|nr:MFS transporter [Rikenella sp.]
MKLYDLRSRSYPWIVVGLLWGVALLNYMDRQMLSTMQDAMKIDIAELQTGTNFGRLMGIFLWVYGLVSPAAGTVADRVSRKWLIVGSLFVWSAVTFGMGYADTFGQLYCLRAVMGVSEALYIPAGLAMIADWHRDRSRSLAVGIHMTGLYTGQAIGGFGATVAAAFSWHATFHWFGIIGMAYALVLIFFLHENRETVAERQASRMTAGSKSFPEQIGSLIKGFGLLFSNIAFWAILFYFAAPSLPGWATKNWLPTLFADSLHIPMEQAGPTATITIAVSSFLGVIAGGILSDRWVRRNLRGRIYTGAIGLGMTVPALLLLGFSTSLVGVVGAGLLFGIGFGVFDANNMPILCQFVSNRYRATAYGIMNMIGVFAGAVVTTVLGEGKDNGNLGAGFAWLSVIVAAAIAVQLFFLRPTTDNMTDDRQ